MIETQGTFYDFLPDGRALVATYLPEGASFDTLRLLWDDPEAITAEQRRKIFALNGEIAAWSGHDPEYTRKNLLSDFLRENLERLQMATISLAAGANCSKSTARMIIDYLINFILSNNVPTHEPLIQIADDIRQYVYACLLHKKCAVCQQKADLHHVDAIGMGYNRQEKPQLGNRVLPLCREHHREIHNIGLTAFLEKYHLEPVELDLRLAKVYGIKG